MRYSKKDSHNFQSSKNHLPFPLMTFRRLSALLIALITMAKAEPIGFNSHIRPLLSDHCFTCHGFDPGAREADLRLDTEEGALANRKNGPGIVPGNPRKSLIWQRITSTDPDDVMPPADHHLHLDETEKKLIRQWIQEGAKYEEHWTFIPVKKPPVSDLAPHPVDALILDKLKSLDLKLSPLAEKETLIRRLSFDLRGLPPTPEEVKNFLADSSPEAWGKLVDSFLADPAFGERFAWPWLDAARYADSNGFQGDAERSMWPWRDWVIDAINRNLPYDDFTVWQIAGDLLPNATHEQKLATGFLRNHAINGEGGSIPEENRVNYVFDMAETVGTVWMGLTFNCCRCHDHKYDPLTQKDYYSLTAFFNQTPVTGAGGDPRTKPVLPTPTPMQIAKEKELRAQLATAHQELKSLTPSLKSKQANWEENYLKNTSQHRWLPLNAKVIKSSDPGLKFETLADNSLLVSGTNPNKATFEVEAILPSQTITSLRLDALRHATMTKGRAARSDSGNFVLTGVEVSLLRHNETPRPLKLVRPQASFEQGNLKIAGTLDQDPNTGWAVWNGKSIDRDHAALFQLSEPFTSKVGDRFKVTLRHDSTNLAHFLGHFRLSVTSSTAPSLTPKNSTIEQLLAIPSDQRNPHQKATLSSAYLKTDSLHQKHNAKIQSLGNEISKIKQAAPRVMIMADQQEHRETYVLAVGSYEAKGEVVEASTPGILPPLKSDAPLNRLDLAQWLVARNHPLTSRVTINRIWQELFGIGLIKSPEDLGVQSEMPVHPELLDWLSADFMDSGWDFKELIKTIVTSQVYQQSSKVDSLALERDPENRYLARAPRYRLPSWMIRDQALALSARLVSHIGGAPVKPYQPAGLWAESTFGKKKYLPDTGESLRRRSIYTFWRRISAPAMVFDNAKRENCEVGSYRTNSPLHALAILNDPHYLEAARDIAYRAHEIDPVNPLQAAFQIITARKPTAEESKIITSMYEKSRIHFEKDPDDLKALLAIGEHPIPEKIDHLTQASLTSTILSLLNTDEALTKE
jgi:hypothetical protein